MPQEPSDCPGTDSPQSGVPVVWPREPRRVGGWPCLAPDSV